MWTYRVVRLTKPDGDVSYGVHEAYDDGDVEKPHSISKEPCAALGDTVEELAADLDRMKAAFGKPVLDSISFERPPVAQG